MLGKLILLDLKVYARMLWKPLLILLMVFAGAASVTYTSFSPLAVAVGFLVLAVLAGYVIYAQIAHYYRHFYSEQGYLTHTLPATPAQRLWSKLLSGFLLHAAAVLLSLFGIDFLIRGALEPMRGINNFPGMWALILEYIGLPGILLFLGVLLLAYFSFFATYSLSISLGMNKTLQRLRGAGIAAALVGIYAVSRLVEFISAQVPLSLRIFINPRWYQMVQIVAERPLDMMPTPGRGVPPALTHLDLGMVSIVYGGAFLVISFLLVHRELRRINLR